MSMDVTVTLTQFQRGSWMAAANISVRPQACSLTMLTLNHDLVIHLWSTARDHGWYPYVIPQKPRPGLYPFSVTASPIQLETHNNNNIRIFSLLTAGMIGTAFYTYQCRFKYLPWWSFQTQAIVVDVFSKLRQAQSNFACQFTPSMRAAEYLGAILVPCNSLLFLLRVRAVSRNALSRMVLYTCTFLWILTFLAFLIPFGIQKTRIATQEDACIYTYDRRIICIPLIVLVVFDSTVMVAGLVGFITHRDTTWYSEMKATITMKNVGPVGRAFLRSGYIYFLSVSNISSFPDFNVDLSCVEPSQAYTYHHSYWS